jgi:hypothetical protein
MEKPVASRTHSAGERPREIFVYIRTHAGAQLFLSATKRRHSKTKMAAKEGSFDDVGKIDVTHGGPVQRARARHYLLPK